jgi:V8-like Glu-specific endopeptidase
MIRNPRLTGALSAIFAAFLIFPTFVVSPATAGSAAREDSPEPTIPRVSAGQTISEAEANAAIQFWTRERMATAKPMTMRSLPDQDGNIARQPAPATVAHGFLGGKSPASSGVAPSSVPASEDYWRYPTTTAPAKSIGKLFFEEWTPARRKWVEYVCSATVIAAENASTVWTAGHCVYETFGNTWNRNYVFCPGYRDNNGTPKETGDCPLGKWTPQYQNTTQQYKDVTCDPGRACSHGAFSFDLGALKMAPQNGMSIEERVGSHVLRYNIQVAYHYLFGYPQGPPFTGRYLYACIYTNQFEHHHLTTACGLTGGASGGPWLAGFNSARRGFVDSVNSHGGAGTIDGPFQGQTAQLLYESMRNI